MDRNPDMTELIGADGIFLRIADRKRFDYVLRGVREDSLSLALSSDNDGLLDHYGRLLINQMRKSDGLQIEVFLPQNTEALLERFNQILADLSIDEARNADTSQAPRRVLLAHDAKAISERDLQLLSRLVQDFPGAHVSIVLLVDKPGIQMHEKTLDQFGQRMLRWPLEAPTREEGEALIAVAGSMGFDVEAKKVLAAIGYAKQPKPAAPIVSIPASAASAAPSRPSKPQEEKTMSGAELAALRQQVLKDSAGRTEPSLDSTVALPKAESAPKTASVRRKILSTVLRWIAALSLVAAVVLIAIVLIFSQRLGPMLYSSPLLKENLPPWAMEKIASVTGKPPSAQREEANAVATPTPATVPAAGADSKDDKPASGNPTVEAKAEAQSEAAKTEQKAETKAEIKAEAKTETVLATAAPVSPAEALAPRSERGVDQAIRQGRPGSYFVQHVSLGSMAEAQEWRAQYAALSKSRIAAVTTQDKGVKYAVVSGPFANLKEAEAFAARPGVPADPWLRPVKSLQRALVTAGR